MDERRIDPRSIIGFALLFIFLMAHMYFNRPSEEEIQAARAEKELQEEPEETPGQEVPVDEATLQASTYKEGDSTAQAAYARSVGDFGITPISNAYSVLENNKIYMEIDHKGGMVRTVRLKPFVTHDSLPVYLVKDGNARFGFSFKSRDNRQLHTSDLYFEPIEEGAGQGKSVTLRARARDGRYIEYQYRIRPDEFIVDFGIQSRGLEDMASTGEPIVLNWQQKTFRQDQSIRYENRYTRLTYRHDGSRVSKLSDSSDEDDDTEEEVSWISYRQHFFSSMLIHSTFFPEARLYSQNLVEEENKGQQFTKIYRSEMPLSLQNGEISQQLHWYYGPTDINVLAQYKDWDLVDSIPFGWGIFGWINRHIFTPLYGWLSSFLPFGIAIIVMTIMVRIAMSPVTYRSYVSQAKMKVLRPEIDEINEKYKENAMKKQQETMKLYNKAGVSPMSGCLPAFLQLPIFYALFMFFPTSFLLRQKSFLWAQDLSSYDTILNLPFYIPFYGDHISLFPILASVAIFFYMQMTTGQSMQMQQQPGMPNMKFIMYLSPVMMLVFFNNYASGLSLYYFISNLITIGIMLVIKNYILNEDKIHAQIQENKKKPKKENKFQKRLREMMEEAEKQGGTTPRKK